MHVASLVLILASLGASALFSCGGKLDCADASAQCTNGGGPTVDCTKSLCPNDPPISSVQADMCRTELAGSCGTAYAALYRCMLPLVQCTTAGTTDQSALTDITTKCSDPINALIACESSRYSQDGGGGWVDGGAK